MLLDELRKTIEDMEEIQGLERDSQDSQKQNKIDGFYASEVADNHKIVCGIENCRKFVKFAPSSLLKEELLQLLMTSQRYMETGQIQEHHLKALQNGTKNVREKFVSEWNTFYGQLSDKRLHTLAAIREIIPDKVKTGYAINKIKNGFAIDYENDNRVRLLAEGLSEADMILETLGLDRGNEIMVFLDKVAGGKATIGDLTDTIAKWIGERNLEDKFCIKFIS